MKSMERKRKRKHTKRSSLMGSNVDKEMDEVESESSGSDSSFDLCEDIDNVERNVVSAENMKSEPGSEGMSSDYDFCDDDVKNSIDESTKSPNAESYVVVSDIGCVDKGSIDEFVRNSDIVGIEKNFTEETVKSSKAVSSAAVSDIGGVEGGSIDEFNKSPKAEPSEVVSDIDFVEKGSINEFVKSSNEPLATISDIGGVEKDSVDEIIKSFKAESSDMVSDIGRIEDGSIDESIKCPEVESSRMVSDIGGVEKSPSEKSMKSSTAEISGAVSDVGGVEKGSIDESMKKPKDEPLGADSDPESDDDVDSEGSMDMEDYYDEQLAEVRYAENPLHTTAYEQVCTNYEEFKAMRLRNIIKEHALPYLPAKSLSRFRSVSKAWDMWIQSSLLALQQSYKFRDLSGYFQERYTGIVSFTSFNKCSYGVPNPFVDFLPVPYGKVTVVSASNGLLLCKPIDGALTYFICNPATMEWKSLPQPKLYHGEKPAVVLAFEPSVRNMDAHYELICAFPRLDEPVLSLEIYSSLTKEWKCIDAICSELAKSKLKSNGFYFNGVAYWETESNEVLAFDLNIGIHGVLPLPSVAANSGGALGQMGGEVCYVCVRKAYDRVIEVSVYAGMGMDLIESVYLNLGSRNVCVGGSRSNEDADEECCRVMPFFRDDTVTLLVDGLFYECNLKERTVKKVSHDINLYGDATYWPYVNSLVRLA